MTLTEYELERQRRLEENKRRLEELGVTQMVADLQEAHAAGQAPKRKKREPKPQVLPHEMEPTRRSKRNEGKEQPNYRLMAERTSPAERRDPNAPLVKEGEMPEEYGLAHVLALGKHEKAWVMFQDGYNEEGERVYDSEKGVTCHQCRQKTLGQHTQCSKCKSGLGALCGDCLFARYGENVEEAAAKEDWVCPCCRDLCNCSRHRKLRKWEATGMLHHRVKSRGYLSVAHYLVLNKLRPGDAAARRAALESGFCPEDLADKLQEELQDIEEAGEAEPAAALGQLVPTPQSGSKDATEPAAGKGGAQDSANKVLGEDKAAQQQKSNKPCRKKAKATQEKVKDGGATGAKGGKAAARGSKAAAEGKGVSKNAIKNTSYKKHAAGKFVKA